MQNRPGGGGGGGGGGNKDGESEEYYDYSYDYDDYDTEPDEPRRVPGASPPPGLGARGAAPPPNGGMPPMTAPPPNIGMPSMVAPPPRGVPSMAAPPPRGMPSMAAPPPRGMPSMAAPPPKGVPSMVAPPPRGMPSMAAPPPAGGGFTSPAGGFAPPAGGGFAPPAGGGFAPPAGGGFAAPPSNAGGDDDEYDYDYEYEYDEEYEYEYEYEDEPGSVVAGSVHGIARPKNPMGGGMGAMISADALNSMRNGLSAVPEEAYDRPAPVASRPFGLTSTKLGDLKSNMKKVERDYEKQAVNQGGDFRGNLKTGGGADQFSAGPSSNQPQPGWMNPNLKKGARPMTTNIQNVDTEAIRQKVLAARDQQQERKKRTNGPRFMNGVPIGSTRVSTRIRVKPSTETKAPPNGRMSAKIALDRKQDPDNPNKFVTKNRVSYKVRKGSSSKRISANPSMAGDANPPMVGGAKPPGMSNGRSSTRTGGRSSTRKGGRSSTRHSTRKSKRVSANPGERGASRRVSRNPDKAKDPNRVSRRHKRPNVSRTSVNNNIFGAKTTEVETPGIGKGDGCYLRFDSNNGGIVFAQWTAVGYETSEALAYFKPSTPVPRFNYRRNEGRIDLMSGTRSDFTKYCEGWTYFWTMAREHEGEVTILDKTGDSDFRVDIWGLSSNSTVEKLSGAKTISSTKWMCIACIPYGSSAFDGVEKVQANFFMNNANRDGAAVRLG